MNIPLMILGIIAVALIFAFAAWAGPKAIRAIYPEEMHESMIKMQRVMVIVAIIVAVLGFGSVLFFAILNG